jgi:hypothetical protein
MRHTIQRSISLIGIAIVTMGLAMAAPKTEQTKSAFNVYGRVLKVDQKEHTLLIKDHWSKKLFLVTMPEGARLQIFFGINKSYSYPTFDNVYERDIVRVRCIRTGEEHLARLDDGTNVEVVTASR